MHIYSTTHVWQYCNTIANCDHETKAHAARSSTHAGICCGMTYLYVSLARAQEMVFRRGSKLQGKLKAGMRLRTRGVYRSTPGGAVRGRRHGFPVTDGDFILVHIPILTGAGQGSDRCTRFTITTRT